MKKSICCIALALVMALSTVGLFASCAKEKEKTLVMATNANFPPYEYKDGAAFAGIDVELAQAIADKLGMKLEIQDVEFGAIVAGVESGKYDIGMAGMTVTEDRKKQVSFSTTYATGVQVVIVKEGSAIQSPADITTSSKIGVEQDTTGDLYASDTPEKGGWGEAAVTRYKNGADAVQALQTGKLDCVIIDKEPAKSFVAANSGLKILDTEYTNEDYAIAVGKNNTELLEKINKALDELKKDGTIDKIVSKYIPADKKVAARAAHLRRAILPQVALCVSGKRIGTAGAFRNTKRKGDAYGMV